MAPKKPRPADSEAANALFHVDSAGSTTIRDSLLHGPIAAKHRRQSSFRLRSLDVLEQIKHHGAPALSSRVAKKKALLTRAEKQALKSQITRRGAISKVSSLANVPAQGSSSGTSTARAKLPTPAQEDIWATSQTSGSGDKVNAPKSLNQLEGVKRVQQLPAAVTLPHPGQSYNPTLEDHQDLLKEAVQQAESEEEKERQAREIKQRLASSRNDVGTVESWTLLESQTGPATDDVDQEADQHGQSDAVVGEEKSKRQPKKKTVQKRKRLALLKLARHAELERRQLRHLRTSLHALPCIQNDISTQQSQSQLDTLERQQSKLSTLARNGFLTRTTMKKTVQLTEDLSETGLRGLKPEGSLWRDWDESARRRGKLERAGYVPGRGSVVGKGKGSVKRGHGMKGRGQRLVEKHGWKNFR